MSEKLKLYFSCALTGLSRAHRARMVGLREILKDHFEVLEFCPAETSPEEIYTHDIHYCVATADLMVSICDMPSIGLGWEMSAMLEVHGKPVLALARDVLKVSPLVRGVTNPCFEIQSYTDAQDILALTLEFAQRRFPKKFP